MIYRFWSDLIKLSLAVMNVFLASIAPEGHLIGGRLLCGRGGSRVEDDLWLIKGCSNGRTLRTCNAIYVIKDGLWFVD